MPAEMGVELRAITGPSVWETADHSDRSAWTTRIGDDELAALTGRDGEDDAPLPVVERIHASLRDGPGFLLVEGFPVDSEDHACELLVRFGRRIGEIAPQTKNGALYSKVQAETGGLVRGARTTRALLYHTDFSASVPQAIGLLSIRAAKAGGDSLVASGHAVHNLLLERDPEALARLYEPFYFDRSGYVAGEDQPILKSPIFELDGNRVLVLHNRARLQRGHLLMRQPLDDVALRALDAVDSILTAEEERYSVRFTIEPGSILFTDNRLILHNRRAFEDHDDPARKRLLIRMWIDV